jgi:basic amino acid/polyamine antiporter, APA family
MIATACVCQVKNPAQDIPIGILGAVGITTICYMLMSAALVLMVPIGSIHVKAPFSSAFASVGMPWAR